MYNMPRIIKNQFYLNPKMNKIKTIHIHIKKKMEDLFSQKNNEIIKMLNIY